MGKLALVLSRISKSFQSFYEWLPVFADLSSFHRKEFTHQALRKICPNTEFLLVRIFPHFACFLYFVSLRIQSECGKVRTRKNSVFGHISRSDSFINLDYHRLQQPQSFSLAKAKNKQNITRRIIRGNPTEVFLRESILKICNKFTGEHPCRSLISIKLLYNLIETHFGKSILLKNLNISNFFRTTFYEKTEQPFLLLNNRKSFD